MNPEPIGTRVSKWGEGPVWHNNLLYYVDIAGQAVLSFDPNTGEEKEWSVDQQVGFVVPCKSGKLLCGGGRGFFYLDTTSGETTDIHNPEPDIETNRINDGKCSPDGRAFGGSISMNKTTGAASLYRLDPDLSCHLAYKGVTNSNGIVWSLDAATCYYIDTPTRLVLAFDYSSETGELTNKREAFSTGAIDASPDGMAIDANGHLWIAFCHGSCVVRFDPDTGEQLQRIEFPCMETTACAFGGPNGNDLYVTTGINGSKDEELAGRLFVIRDIGVSGKPAFVFAG
ncbi:MAG: SMP-30/gluconolactonase/LRE family protein [Verrucomicrobiota bacterium]